MEIAVISSLKTLSCADTLTGEEAKNGRNVSAMNALARWFRYGYILMWCAIMAGILYFGLRPFNHRIFNNAHTTSEGISIGSYGMAYSPVLRCHPDGYAFGMVFTTAVYPDRNVPLILELIDESNGTPVVTVGQWKNHLVFREWGGMDVSILMAPEEVISTGKPVTFGFSACRDSVYCFVNGTLRSAPRHVKVQVPGARVVLGNSARGHRQWTGIVRQFRWYEQPLCGPALKHGSVHDAVPAGGLPFSIRTPGHEQPLTIKVPRLYTVLRKRMLIAPWIDFELSASYGFDVVLNFLGFIPLGICTMLVLVTAGFHNRRLTGIYVVAGSFALSLAIEILQAWLPSRSSQWSDVLLNGTGAAVGVVVFLMLYREAGKVH
jgi:hypothetical protein